ncbi:hypothetical protein [Micromonospora sp. NPDC023814]|uniref:hypothetical protein n=1 Tax=Micromonospora sp. NPDC023814 TaxID=3154596 RepID=UPI0033DE4297
MVSIEDLLQRRTDLSTFLIHLTRDTPGDDGPIARENLLTMIGDGYIEARSPFGPALVHEPNLTYAATQKPGRHLVLLLYAQPLSWIHRLASADIIETDQELFIRLGEPPTPGPGPVRRPAAPTRRRSTANEHGWLFPGQFADQPITYGTLSRRLRQLGFPPIDARGSALRQLVLQAPAPVVANALGFHQKSTARQVAQAGAT